MRVGDYVRTPNGVIARIIDVQDEEGQYFINGNAVSLSSKNYIADKGITIGENFKHSPNIIDILEVGDYVNGYEVTSKDQFLGFGNHDWYMTNDEIKSIVTKEQFSAMEYKVESEVK